MKIDCVLLAAGSGRRFGSNKLLFPVDGVPMAERALALHAAQPYAQRVLVTRKEYEAVAALGVQYGYTVLYNDAPERGMGTSAAIGARFCMADEADGALFGVCDQPYLTHASVAQLLELFLQQPERIVSAACGTRRGNPCVFPRQLFSELAALDGETGGGRVIERHRPLLQLADCFSEQELTDLDVVPMGENG